MLMHAIALRGCTDPVRETIDALKLLWEDKISCRSWDSNPRQYGVWLYQLSYSVQGQSQDIVCLFFRLRAL